MGDVTTNRHPNTPFKLKTIHKKAIITMAIEGRTVPETAQLLREQYGLDVSTQTVWITRSKNAKRIAAALEDELNRAVALSPMATLENRLSILERVVKEGFDDYQDAIKQLNSDEELNPEQEAMLRMKGIRSLQAVNDAVKIADAAMSRMRALHQKMKEYNAKNNLGTRDLVEETILTVQKRVYQADEKATSQRKSMAEVADDVDWIEMDDLED